MFFIGIITQDVLTVLPILIYRMTVEYLLWDLIARILVVIQKKQKVGDRGFIVNKLNSKNFLDFVFMNFELGAVNIFSSINPT